MSGFGFERRGYGGADYSPDAVPGQLAQRILETASERMYPAHDDQVAAILVVEALKATADACKPLAWLCDLVEPSGALCLVHATGERRLATDVLARLTAERRQTLLNLVA